MQAKRFHYDELLQKEDICNLSEELRRIQRGIQNKEKMVVYGKRNSGKTSLVKNVVIPNFRKKHRKSFVLFVDLMQVKDLESINSRIRVSFEQSFHESFPKKAFVENIKKYIQGLRPVIKIDPLSGEPSLSIDTKVGRSDGQHFCLILDTIRNTILKDMPGLIVFDEFQDITFVSEAAGLFRNALQHYCQIPVILMGSKKHLLGNMFAKPNAPFADFGSDIEFHNIPYDEYHEYVLERFKENKLNIDFEIAKIWQDLLFRNPEAINIVGASLMDQYENKMIHEKDIRLTIDKITKERKARFEELLSVLSSNEENVLVAVAKFGPILQPSSKHFLKKVKPSHGTVNKVVKHLLNLAMIEKTEKGYRLTNPLLHYYLQRFR